MRRPSHRRHDRGWPRRPRWLRDFVTAQSIADILRRLYVDKDEPEMMTQWWVALAYERHWISGPAARRIQLVPTGRITRSITSLMSEPSPLFGLIKRRTIPTSQETPA